MAVKKMQRRGNAPRQKFVQQTLKNKGQQKHEASTSSTKNKKALIIAQEIKFARLLSNNDKRVRDKVLKNFKKWLTVRSKSSFAFTEADFMRLWKGLFYCMWMSDKPLIQEELAESLSKIVHCFDTKDVIVLYTSCTLNTLATEWFGIDQYRLDKFAMLVRRIVRQTFEVLRARSWDLDWVKEISQMFGKLLQYPKSCLGFGMHLVEIYLEELSKVSCGEISEETVTELLKPFVMHLATAPDERLSQHIMKHVFRHLIFQSDVGLDYMEKFKAWRQAGFPAGHIDAMQKIEVSDEEGDVNVEEEGEGGDCENQQKQDTMRPLDPRAGKVDVELPQIPFNPGQIINLLKEYRFHSSTSTNSRRQIARLIAEFSKLAQNEMPLGIKEIEVPTKKRDKSSKSAALRLLKFEEELYSDNPPHKRKRKKKANLIDDENSYDESSDVTIEENDTADEDLEGISQKKKKKIQKENAMDHSVQAELPECSTSVQESSSKKKNTRAEKKRQSNCETDMQSNNSKLEKVISISTNLNNTSKKTKSKQNKASAGNKLKAIQPVKRKKTAKFKACGSWDISDCAEPSAPASVINGNVELSTKVDNSPATNKPADKNNMLNKDMAWLVPVIKKLENENMTTPEKTSQPPKTGSDSSIKKRVKIVLQRNTAQHTSEYIQQIRQSPAIPFDANKKPLASVLKASPIPSPINPFYKRNLK